MAWIEVLDRRGRASKTWRDTEYPGRHILESFLGVNLHYASDPDSSVLDAQVDFTPVRINNESLDGWMVTAAGYHYALGIPSEGDMHGQDGVVGFGGRRGQNWLQFRLLRCGYLRWTQRTWQDVSGPPTYNRSNLSQQLQTITIGPNNDVVNVGNMVTWDAVWPGVSVRWRLDGNRLKEEIVISQAAREALPPPSTPAAQNWFGFVFRLDASDIPQWAKNGVIQNIEGDFNDIDSVPIEMRDSLGRFLALLPIDYAWSEANPEQRIQLRKRIWFNGADNAYYLLVGGQVTALNALPAGAIVFDPTIDVQVGARADDGYTNPGGFVNNGVTCIVGQIGPTSPTVTHSWARFTGITGLSGVTIDVAYYSVYNSTSSANTLTTIYANDAEAPTAPTSNGDYNGKTVTTAGVNWDGAYTGTWNNSPSIVSVIQELADSYDPSAIMILHKNRGSPAFTSNVYLSYDTAGNVSGPKLHIEYTGAGGTQYEQAVAGTLTPAGTVIKRTGKATAGTLTPAGTVIKRVATTLAGVLTPAGTVIKRTAKALGGTLTPTGIVTAVKTALLSLGGTLGLSGEVSKRTTKTMSGSITPDGSLTRRTAKALTGALTSSGNVVKQTTKALAGTLTSSGVVGTVKAALISLGGTLGLSGEVVKRTTKTLVGSVTPAGELVKQTAKALAGALTPAGAVVKRVGKALAGTLTPAGAVVKQVGKALSGTLTTAGNVVKRTGKAVSGALSTAGDLIADFISGGGGGTQYLQSIGGTLNLAGEVAKRTGKALVGTLTPSGSISKAVTKSLTGALLLSGSVTKRIGKALAGVLSWAGTVLGITVVGTVDLTLHPRTVNLTLESRSVEFTLHPRTVNLTLPDLE